MLVRRGAILRVAMMVVLVVVRIDGVMPGCHADPGHHGAHGLHRNGESQDERNDQADKLGHTRRL